MTPEQERRLAEQRKKDEERVYGAPERPDQVTPEEKQRRERVMVDFEMTFLRQPHGEKVLQELARVFHFTSPTITEEDRILANAFRTILHYCGKWGDDRVSSDEVIHRLITEVR